MLALFFLIFLQMAAFATLLPSVMYVLTNLGVSPSLATPVLASYSFAQFLAGPAWGRLSDKWGRKPVLAMTITGACLSYVSVAFFGDSVAGIFIGYALAGTFAGASAVIYASVTDITGPEKRAKGMGIIGAGIGLAFTLGPALGAHLGGKSAASAGIEMPATASAIICLVGLLVVLFMVKETASHREGEAVPTPAAPQVGRLAAMKRVARHPIAFQMAIMLMAFTMAMTMMESTLPLLANVRHGWGPRDMGIVFAYIGLVLIFVQGGLVGRLAQRYGERPMVRAGLLSMAIGLGLLAFVPAEWAIYVGLTGAAVGSALFNTAMLALASHRAEAHERGLVMGVFQSMQPLGRSVGPLIAGSFYQAGHTVPLIVGCVYMALAFLWFATLKRRMEQEASEAEAAA